MDENNAQTSAPPLDLSSAIEGILAHPELISMVASTLGKAPPTAAVTPKRAEGEASASPLAAIAESAPSEALPTEAISALAPLLSGLGGIKKGAPPSAKKDDPRICLLLALKPYMSAVHLSQRTRDEELPLRECVQERQHAPQTGHVGGRGSDNAEDREQGHPAAVDKKGQGGVEDNLHSG